MKIHQTVPSYVTSKNPLVVGENTKSLPLVLPTNRTYDPKENKVFELPKGHFVNPHTGNVEKDAKWSNKVYIVKEGVAFLQSLSVDKKLTTVSTVGPARTGKSYILSMLLGDKNAFELGHTMDACTHGIWVGTKTIEIENLQAEASTEPKTTKSTLVVFDTEGLDAFSGTQAVDDRIFLLSIFLSSYLIYNSMHVPNSKDLKQMEYIANLTTRIHIENEEEADGNELRKHFPNLLWLLRDVSLIPMIDKKKVTPREFLLKKVLAAPPNSTSTESALKTSISTAILKFFKTLDCETLPCPSEDPEICREIDTVDESELSQQFVQQRDVLLAKIMKELTPKTFYVGQNIAPMDANGDSMSKLLAEFINQINNGVPSLLSTSEQVEQITASAAISKGVEEYNKQMTANIANLKVQNKMEQHVPLELTELLEIHNAIMNEIFKQLKSEIFYPDISRLHKHFETFVQRIATVNNHTTTQGQSEVLEPEQPVSFEKIVEKVLGTTKLEDVTGGELLKYLHQNSQQSLAYCNKIIQDLYAPIKANLMQPQSYSHAQFLDDVTQFELQYHDLSRGPEKIRVFKLFIDTTVEADKENIKLLQGYNEQLHQQKQKEMQLEAKLLEEKAIQERHELEKKTQHEQQKQMLQAIKEDHERQMQLFKEQIRVSQEAEAKRLQALLDAQLQQQAEQQQELIATMQTQMEQTQRMMAQQQKDTLGAITKITEAIQKMPSPQVHVSGGGCFTEDSLVKTSTGFVKVSSLQVGDQVESLNMKTGEIEMSSIYLINEHPETFSVRYISYWNDKTGEENTLKLTDDHLVYIQQRHPAAVNKKQLVEAKNVMVQDMIYVLEGAAGKREEMKKCKVLKVEQQEATRVFGIMTMNDTLIVNGVLCSCFTMNEMWGKLDNIVPKALFSIHPSIVKTQAFKKFVALYDSIVEANFGRIWTFVRG